MTCGALVDFSMPSKNLITSVAAGLARSATSRTERELLSGSQRAKRAAQTPDASARTVSDTYKNLDAGCGVSDIHKFTPQTLCHERVALTAARKPH